MGGAYTTHNTRDCCRFETNRKGKSNFRTAKNGGKKGNPMNQNFAQLIEKIKKLEKVLKKSGKKGQSTVTRIVIPTLNKELGWVALGK
jgi:hypothetical protein